MKIKSLARVLHVAFILVSCAPTITPLPDTIQQPASVVQNTVVGLDPGHGWGDSKTGAIGNGLVEKDVNLEIALLTKQVLENNGIEVVMTREKDNYDKTLNQAAVIMNKASPVLVVSIHTNSGGNTASGTEACYTVGKNTDEQSKQIAQLLTESISNTFSIKNRGIFPENSESVCGRGRGRLYIHDMNAPSAIIETGFLSNPTEAELLKNKKSEYAQAIAQAIMSYLGIRKPSILSAAPSQPSPPSIAVTIEAATIVPTEPTEPTGVLSLVGVWSGNVQISGEFSPHAQEMTFKIYPSCQSGNPCITVLNADGSIHIDEPPSLDIPYEADNHLRGDFCFEYSLLVTGEHAPPFFTACFTLQPDGSLAYVASGALWAEEGVLYKVSE